MIAGVSGALLLLVMFVFTWFDIELPAQVLAEADTGVNAWQAFGFIDIVLFVACLVAVGLAVATMNSANVGLPVAGSALTAGLGIISLILVAYRLVNPPDAPLGLDTERGIGLFLGLILTAGIAYGGWLGMQEEGTSFSEQADRLQARDDEPAPPPPPAPPTGSAGGPPVA